MDLSRVVRRNIAKADRLTKSLQTTITHYAWTDSDTYSKPSYATGITYKAVVDFQDKMKKMPSGEDVVQKAQITIVGPVAANGASGRTEPIDTRDRIVLANGYTGPILSVDGGVLDPLTNAPYMLEVTLG